MSATAASEALADQLRDAGIERPDVAIVLGSGLGAFAERLSSSVEVPYDSLEGLPQSTVPGHSGRFVAGELDGARVLAQAGRVHLYEGHSSADVTLAVRAVAALGCPALVLTNAAGGLRAEWQPGTLMRIADHLNLQGTTPLTAEQRGYGTPWDPELGELLHAAATEREVPLEQGVYAALPGPSYETPAEIRALRTMGADAVGMSTAAEALAGCAAGMRVAGISCITNLAAGVGGEPLDHQEVIDTGRATADRFAALLETALPRIGHNASRRLRAAGEQR